MIRKSIPSLADRVKDTFKQVFGVDDFFIVRSPGRVNLIGEHTDYNNGFVLPAAIDKAIYMSVSRRTDDAIHIVSLDLDKAYTGDSRNISPTGLHWPDYVLGVVRQLQATGKTIGGFNCVFAGD